VTLTNQFHVDTQFITSDLLLSMDMFSKRVLKPKIATIANRIDYDLSIAMQNAFYNNTGTPGTPPTTVAPWMQAGAWLDSEAVPRDGNRYAVLDQWTQASMAGALTTLFNPQKQVGDQYKKGRMGVDTFGFDFYTDQNITAHTFGALGGTPQYDSTIASSALKTTGWADTGTFGTKGWTNSTAVVKVGDVFSCANVLAVNPQNRSSWWAAASLALRGGDPHGFAGQRHLRGQHRPGFRPGRGWHVHLGRLGQAATDHRLHGDLGRPVPERQRGSGQQRQPDLHRHGQRRSLRRTCASTVMRSRWCPRTCRCPVAWTWHRVHRPRKPVSRFVWFANTRSRTMPCRPVWTCCTAWLLSTARWALASAANRNGGFGPLSSSS
jgi:hypothetical protein